MTTDNAALICVRQFGRLFAAVALLFGHVELANANPLRNPGYSCAGGLDPAAEVICGDDQLSKASLELSQAYYAVRGVTDQSLWQAYKQIAVEFLRSTLRNCDIPNKGSVGSDRFEWTKNCLMNEIQAQKSFWINEIWRINKYSALEEALRDTEENTRLQQLIKDQGWLPATADIDDVFGEGTRQAIRRMQETLGLPPDGMLSNKTASLIYASMPTAKPDDWIASKNDLPVCPAEPKAYWTGCIGAITFRDGSKYVGDWVLGFI